MNSDSIVDLANNVCLEDFQDTAAPPSVNTYPLVDFEFFWNLISSWRHYSLPVLLDIFQNAAHNFEFDARSSTL